MNKKLKMRFFLGVVAIIAAAIVIDAIRFEVSLKKSSGDQWFNSSWLLAPYENFRVATGSPVTCWSPNAIKSSLWHIKKAYIADRWLWTVTEYLPYSENVVNEKKPTCPSNHWSKPTQTTK